MTHAGGADGGAAQGALTLEIEQAGRERRELRIVSAAEIAQSLESGGCMFEEPDPAEGSTEIRKRAERLHEPADRDSAQSMTEHAGPRRCWQSGNVR